MWNSRLLSALKDRYQLISFRDQPAIMLGLGAVVVFFLLQFVFFPMYDRQRDLKFLIKSKENDLSELKAVVEQYRRQEASGGKSTTKIEEGSLNLFSTLERLAAKSGLKDNIDYMKPGSQQLDSLKEEKWVEVKLSRITLKEFIEYLYGLQSFERGMYIKRLSARKEGGYLNLTLQPAIIEGTRPAG